MPDLPLHRAPYTPEPPRPAPNKDRVTPPVLTRTAILGALGFLAAVGVDLGLDTDQTNRLVDALLVVLPLLGSLAGAAWGTIRARQDVTPILEGDTPRNADGKELVTAEQVLRRPSPRVDRRGVDRDPGP
jgi:hypothetical protein